MITSEFLNVHVENCGLQKIILNKPEKKNALDGEMIISITNLLRESAKDPNVKLTAFSGVGTYFTSGNDLNNFLQGAQTMSGTTNEENIDANILLQNGVNVFKEFVAAFIDYPKPLVAVVNGPAIGIGVTLLAHFDLVFASNLATFHCPFVTLGQTPEGCSSLLFPDLMGHSKAAELLLFGKKMSAYEAFDRNLVTQVVDHAGLASVWERLRLICSLPPNTLRNAKSAVKARLIPKLHQVNHEECKMLAEQYRSEEFIEAFMKFMTRKSKL